MQTASTAIKKQALILTSGSLIRRLGKNRKGVFEQRTGAFLHMHSAVVVLIELGRI